MVSTNPFQCSRERPGCSTCWSKRTECVYETEEGQSRLEHLRSINSHLRDKVDDMSIVINFLQSGSYPEAMEVLNRLRGSQNLQETARLIKDSQLILPSGVANDLERMQILHECSMDSSDSTAGQNTDTGGLGSITDASSLESLQSSISPTFPPTCLSGVNITLPSLASLTCRQDSILGGTPSPRSHHDTLPPLNLAVEGAL